MAIVQSNCVELSSPDKIATAPSVNGLPYIETPLVKSVILSKQFNANVWLKFEQAQPSGSFKSRGLGWLVYKTLKDNPGEDFHFFCASGGNAGYAAACAAQQYKQKCTVCLPTSSDPLMVRRIEQTGAVVIRHGKTIAESDDHIKLDLLEVSRLEGENPIYCHPYDHELVWEGNSSIAEELVQQTTKAGFKPDAIVCSVGGGGLYNGIVQGLQHHNWNDVEVVAAETYGCNTLQESIRQHSQYNLEAPTTICTSLATRNVSLRTIEYALNVQPTHSVVVSDKDAVEACVAFAETHKMLVEPACGVALAPLYTGNMPEYLKDSNANIVVIVCGGSNITYRKLDCLCQKFGVEFTC